MVGHKRQKKVSLSLEDLKFHANGLICLTGGMNGLVKKQFDNQDTNKTSILLDTLQKIFYERLYLEIQREEPNIDSPFNEFIINCSLKINICRGMAPNKHLQGTFFSPTE